MCARKAKNYFCAMINDSVCFMFQIVQHGTRATTSLSPKLLDKYVSFPLPVDSVSLELVKLVAGQERQYSIIPETI